MKISKVKKVRVVGVIPSFAFQRAKYCALELHRKLPQRFPQPEIIGLLELDWNEKLTEWRQVFGREYWCLRRPVAVFFDDKFIGSDLELLKLTSVGNIVLENIPRRNATFMKEHFRKDYVSFLKKAKRIYCYLDICVDDAYIGTMTFELYSDILPRTCENFKTLCLGNRGSLLSYKGSRIHRVVKNGWLQGGDIQYKTGGGGFSIFCDPLEDENFSVSHDKRGVLSMANGGRHSNASQFFVTLQPSKWMDTHFVAFGQLIEGSAVLKHIENLETFYECPLKKVEIKNCGKLNLEDVEDVDAAYKEVPLPKKKPKIFERVSEQILRLVMEALTEALARKERQPDVLDEGDVPSKMNLQLYFQGLYSIPDEILEDSAQYLRNLRRSLFRTLKPSATEVVEVLMYDLLMAVLTRMTTLDDVRNSIGRETYEKMIGGIDMEFELCQKPYVKKLVNQIISTAQSVISLVNKKVVKMKIMSTKTQVFQKKMQDWVQSFVMQETFKGHSYKIADRLAENLLSQPVEEAKVEVKREGKPCCNANKKQEKDFNKLKGKYPSADICCIGSALFRPETIQFSDYFRECMHDIKRLPKDDPKEMSIVDLIESSRFKLRWMRKKENAEKPKTMIKLENKIRKWIEEVVYTPETSWIKNVVYEDNEIIIDHTEEIMYGAMTAGLLEMYYFYEQYLKSCGGKQQKIIERIIEPEESSESSVSFMTKSDEVLNDLPNEPEPEPLPPCSCGHPCCVCASDPNYRPPTPPPSIEEETVEDLGVEVMSANVEVEEEIQPCGAGTELVDLNALLAEKLAMKPEEIDVRSFKWLKPYILTKGCDLKTEFATRAHRWIEGESFSCKGFISRHSIATRASLLSLSVSLAEIITDKNQIKSDIKNFIYDLWDLYFQEMFNEAILEQPPDEKPIEEFQSDENEEEEEAKMDEDECKKILAQTPDFDFTKFCARFAPEGGGDAEETKLVENAEEEEEKRDVELEPVEEPIKEESITVPASSDDVNKKKEEEELSDEEKDKSATKTAISDQVQTHEEEGEIKKSRKKSPIIIQEVIEVSSGDESRHIPPYTPPFWVKFLTELTKQALGALAKVSRLPRRLYFQTNADIDFDNKMKEWFEFNAFNPQPTKGREIMEYITLHHKSLDNLEDTARSYLKKKKYSALLNRCTRFTSAEAVADEIVVDVIKNAMYDDEDTETVQLYVSNLISSAVASSRKPSEISYEEEEYEENEFETDERYSFQSKDE